MNCGNKSHGKMSYVLKNVAFGFGGQMLILLIAFFIPRVMIKVYGSDVNGLMTTISQIFTYAALLEAGISQAAKNALYKPFTEGDKKGMSQVATVARRYFRRATIYYGIVVCFLSLLMPFIIKTNLDHFTVFWLSILEGMAGVISFFCVETETTLLVAVGKSYINSVVGIFLRGGIYCAKLLLASLGVNIIVIQLVYFAIGIIRVVIYKVYMRKEFAWINYNESVDGLTLEDRSSYVVTEIAGAIFSFIDVVVISIFIGTTSSSVYSVYCMVFVNVANLLSAIYFSICNELGRAYYVGMSYYEKMHDVFVSVFLGGITAAMSVAYLLSIPFIKLYTRGVADTNYIYEYLPLMFCLVQILSWSRYVSGNLTGLAGYAKETSRISLIEALINLVFSIIFVNIYGIVGVLFATVIALPIKVVWCIYIADKRVMNRSYVKTLSILGINYFLFFLTVIMGKFFPIHMTTVIDFLRAALTLSVICGGISIVANGVVNPDCVQMLFEIIKGRKFDELE